LVRPDLVSIMQQLNALRSLGLQSITMTTNGITLTHKLATLISAGLNSINISLDTLDPLKFELITRRKGHNRVLQGMEASLESRSLEAVKINCVVMRNINDNELCDFVSLTRHKPIHVRFIEYMPFDGNRWTDVKFVSYKQMLDTIKEKYPSIERQEDQPSETSKNYRVPGFQGKFGFISSMSDHFCHTCNRLRLTADGNLKVCLFGANEVSLRDAIRRGYTEQQLRLLIGAAVQRKKARHAGMFEIAKSKNRPMITIGG